MSRRTSIRIREESFNGAGPLAGFKLNAPDRHNSRGRSDEIDYSFAADFDPGEKFSFICDLDKDGNNFILDFRRVLFDADEDRCGVVTVSFSNGISLSQTLKGQVLGKESYTFDQKEESDNSTPLDEVAREVQERAIRRDGGGQGGLGAGPGRGPAPGRSRHL